MRLPSLHGRRSATRLVGLLALLVATGCAGPALQRESAGTARNEPRTAPDGAQRPSAGARTPPRPAAQQPGRAAPPPVAQSSGDAPAESPPGTGRGGGYYLDDGPPADAPPDLESIGDAQPRVEPLHPRANRPYTVFGREYVPMTLVTVHRQRGIASWYGRRFHGRRTASGERYDMYGMTAAHPTLPIPSYVRVTNVRNGRSVVVRVNDRGPFLRNRAIDLSYTAALKLDYVQAGSAEVDIELVRPDELQSPQQPERPQPQQPLDQVASAASADAVPPSDRAAAGSAGAAGTADGADPIATAETAAATAATAPAGTSTPAAATAPDGVATTREPDPSPRLTIETILSDAAPVAASVPASAAVGSHYLQLGAFTTRARAEAARAGFRREFGWLKARIEVVDADGQVYRVQAGPWPSRDEALRVAERIADGLSERPIAVVR